MLGYTHPRIFWCGDAKVHGELGVGVTVQGFTSSMADMTLSKASEHAGGALSVNPPCKMSVKINTVDNQVWSLGAEHDTLVQPPSKMPV